MSLEVTTSQTSASNQGISAKQIRREHAEELDAIARYQRVTDYLAAAQIYLKQNVLLQEPLKPEDIKDRLLGHCSRISGFGLPCSS